MNRALLAVGLLIVVMVIVMIIWLTPKNPNYLDRFQVKVLSARYDFDGSIRVEVLLTNGTDAILNVIDDAGGNAAFWVESSDGSQRSITERVNNLKLNLTAGGAVTNVVILTDPPSKFRLVCSMRNLSAESRVWRVYKFLPSSLAEKTVEWRRKEWDLPFRHTEWIELAVVTNGPVPLK